MFSTAQVLKLYEYDLQVLQSVGVRERFLDEPAGKTFIVKQSKPRDFRVSLKELLKPGMFEELCRRFS